MVNYQKVYGLLGLATKAGKIVAGTDACLEAIDKKSIYIIFLAKDASERTKNLFYEKGKKFSIMVVDILSMEELSKAIGKQNKVVIGVKEKEFAQAIEKIINGGEMIG